MSEVRLRVWRVEPHSPAQFLLILVDERQQILPMSIGLCEAVSIQSVMRGDKASLRLDNTHDLLGNLILRLGGKLSKVVIDDIWKKVYFAKLHITLNGETLAVDSRPSDAIAIALRMGAPLYATELVLAAANESEEETEREENPPDFEPEDA